MLLVYVFGPAQTVHGCSGCKKCTVCKRTLDVNAPELGCKITAQLGRCLCALCIYQGYFVCHSNLLPVNKLNNDQQIDDILLLQGHINALTASAITKLT